jgi:hypothetical protein
VSAPAYQELAEAHKPQTAEGIAAAARELVRNGLTDHDVAHVLRLDVELVRRFLGHCGTCE